MLKHKPLVERSEKLKGLLLTFYSLSPTTSIQALDIGTVSHRIGILDFPRQMSFFLGGAETMGKQIAGSKPPLFSQITCNGLQNLFNKWPKVNKVLSLKLKQAKKRKESCRYVTRSLERDIAEWTFFHEIGYQLVKEFKKLLAQIVILFGEYSQDSTQVPTVNSRTSARFQDEIETELNKIP